MHTKYFGTVIYASDTRVSFTRFNFRRNVQMSHLLTLTVTLFPGEKILTATACNNNACQLQRVGCGSTFKRFVLCCIGLFIYRGVYKLQSRCTFKSAQYLYVRKNFLSETVFDVIY